MCATRGENSHAFLSKAGLQERAPTLVPAKNASDIRRLVCVTV
jgi:hypothetical protein